MLHGATQAFWMTDADIEKLSALSAAQIEDTARNYRHGDADPAQVVIADLLRSLRDQYEAGSKPSTRGFSRFACPWSTRP